VVVLDVHDGSVLAMASNPTYPLSWWVGGISPDHFALLSNAGAQNPLLNRVTTGQYAPGSTFKLVPAIALNQYNVLGASTYVPDNGSVILEGRPFKNDNGTVNGPVDLQRALTVSSDVYFYNAGNDFWKLWKFDPNNGLGIQHVAAQLGFGTPTGIEISEASGRVPDPTWKIAFANAINQTKAEKQANAIWYPGDNINAAVGQGDVLATPLQLANAYACFANGGTLWTPHVGEAVLDPITKKVIQAYRPKSRGSVAIGSFTRQQMEAGFAGAVSNPSGTAYPAFTGMTTPAVAGKTGTAQVTGKGPTSLFASYFPVGNPDYAVVAVVEQGGHGAQTAAPIVRQVIESITHQPVTPIPRGNGTTGKD
jgi:penicillin-binding protein 2